MKKYLSIFLGIIMLFNLVGCSNNDTLVLTEFQYVEYNGKIYDLVYDWQPSGEKLNNKISVHITNYLTDSKGDIVEDIDIGEDKYLSTVDYSKEYDAYGYSGDTNNVFLFFNNRIYVQRYYKFPSLMDETLNIQKISLKDKNSNIKCSDDEEFIDLFMREFRSSRDNLVKINKLSPREKIIQIYISDYFAYNCYNILNTNKKGDYGFLVSDNKIKLLSDKLNEEVKEVLKK